MEDRAGQTFLTKEQFGVDLYEAVKTCGRIMWCRDAYTRSVLDRDTAAMARELELRRRRIGELAEQIRQLSGDDAAELVARYPWALHV